MWNSPKNSEKWHDNPQMIIQKKQSPGGRKAKSVHYTGVPWLRLLIFIGDSSPPNWQSLTNHRYKEMDNISYRRSPHQNSFCHECNIGASSHSIGENFLHLCISFSTSHYKCANQICVSQRGTARSLSSPRPSSAHEPRTRKKNWAPDRASNQRRRSKLVTNDLRGLAANRRERQFHKTTRRS